MISGGHITKKFNYFEVHEKKNFNEKHLNFLEKFINFSIAQIGHEQIKEFFLLNIIEKLFCKDREYTIESQKLPPTKLTIKKNIFFC